jgi:BMFP domain-containing protein YqiC
MAVLMTVGDASERARGNKTKQRSGTIAVKRRKIPTPPQAAHRWSRPSWRHNLRAYRGNDMIDVHSIDQLAHRLATLVPPGLAQARDDMEANFKDVLAHGLRRLDLVTREEFDAQRAVLERAREQVTQLEQRVTELEAARKA